MARSTSSNIYGALRGRRTRTPKEAAASMGMTPQEIKRHNERVRRTGRGSMIKPRLMKGRGEF